jgi:CRISPR-associated endonuclease Csn1
MKKSGLRGIFADFKTFFIIRLPFIRKRTMKAVGRFAKARVIRLRFTMEGKMTEEKENRFFIGLDIGTESVGFSATDGEYNVLKSGGKPLMGVRLFDEAQAAADRRVKRANKVRKNRQKQRLTLLQGLFENEIYKIDPLFFIRLSASSFWEEDKKNKNEKLDLNSLFADSNFNDKAYSEIYKSDGEGAGKSSVYHLRKALMDKNVWAREQKPDLRLVYLACHHILKHRGHFLWEADKIDFNAQGKGSIERLNEKIDRVSEGYEDCEGGELVNLRLDIPENFDEVLNVFQNDKLGKSKKQEELAKLLFANDGVKKKYKKETTAILKAITGGNFNLNDLFNFDESLDVEKEEASCSFDSVWEEKAPKISQALNDDDKFAVIETLKEVYDFAELNAILKGEQSISAAMVKKFDEHHMDLVMLKKFVQTVLPRAYYRIFRSAKEFAAGAYPKPNTGNYANLVGSNLNAGKQIVKKVDKQGFYTFLLKILSDNNLIEKQGKNPYGVKADVKLTEEQKEKLQTILEKIESGAFLPKLRTKDNGTIPFQIHKYELCQILNNASEYYDFLNDEDNDDRSAIKSVKDKIISLISFRIPYYVGRLNAYKGNNANRPVWAERKIQPNKDEKYTKITPWTIENNIDYDLCAEKFIGRMLSKCTYLTNETVLPKNSLLYSKFAVLNELNKVKIRGVSISVDLKQRIFNDLFSKEKNVTANKLLKYLQKTDNTLTAEDLSGFDVKGKGFNASLSSLISAAPIIEQLTKEPYNMTADKVGELIENVLLRQALHNDKSRVEKYIKNEYPTFGGEIIKKLKSLNYGGFGKLSGKFLTDGERIDLETGEFIQGKSVMDLLWETQENLMEIIHNPAYMVEAWIAFENNKTNVGFSYDDIAESYGAPSVKRAVWESVKIIDELIKLNGGKTPDKIFVEVTRETGDKNKGKRTESRKTRLEEIYKNAKITDTELGKLLSFKTDAEMRSEKLFLYFLQCGKCAYSGEAIDINDLMNNNKYDIDHIIPQALIKDDGIDNKVLAKKELNAKKDKSYPLNKIQDIWKNIGRLRPMWQSWEKAGLISDAKFERLNRTQELSEKELEGFIARQLVFAGQSATLVASLLKKKFAPKNEGDKTPEIVYSKAGNVSDFRQNYYILLFEKNGYLKRINSRFSLFRIVLIYFQTDIRYFLVSNLVSKSAFMYSVIVGMYRDRYSACTSVYVAFVMFFPLCPSR